MTYIVHLGRKGALFKCLELFTTIMFLAAAYNESNASMTNAQELASKKYLDETRYKTPLNTSCNSIVPIKWEMLKENTKDIVGSITYGDGKIVVVSDSNVQVFNKKQDGSWGYNEAAQTLTNIGNIMIYAEEKFIGDWNDASEYKLITSSDGINWRIINFCFGKSPISAIAYGNGMYVVAVKPSFFYSPDLINWTKVSLGFDFTPFGLMFGNGIFVSIDNRNDVPIQTAYSYDGKNWMLGNPMHDIFGTSAPVSITSGNNKFVAVNRSSNIFVSLDGIKWTIINNTFGILQSVAFGNDIFGIFARDGYLSSFNSENWQAIRYPHVLPPKNLCAHYNYLQRPHCSEANVVYGNGGFIMSLKNVGLMLAHLTYYYEKRHETNN